MASTDTDKNRPVKMYPLAVDGDELSGYVNACSLKCAKICAENIGRTLRPDADEIAEDDDHIATCDACAYPDPMYCAEVGIGEDEEDEESDGDHTNCPDCGGKGIVPLYNPDGTKSGEMDACDGP